MQLPHDYAERVYAGVLGKIIGVYLGRPFEGWTHERIMAELGPIEYYVNEQLGAPLVVTDDDISGTFTFLRALPDYGNPRDLTAAQIGQTWLNYIVERRTILWWGGLGVSTEHTAYMRLKQGTPAPQSGSIALNGKTVAEQIGSQIFIDGWAMVAPGDPELAADLARRAASVSHDGEAIYGAQVVAAMEAQAFVERDLGKLIDTAVALIPRDSLIYRLIDDIRGWHAQEPDWRATRALIAGKYGYDKFGGACHMVPNHALIIHALLHGDDDFHTSQMIVNTCGWDTDCNAANVGCLLGIKNGLAALDAGPDWRGPIADRLYLPTADGGRAISDALTETYHVVNIGRALAGAAPVAPKGGARFHFDLPGAVQGFVTEDSPATRGAVEVANVAGHSRAGQRSLALRYRGLAPGRAARVATATFIPPDAIEMPGSYSLLACPTLYPGQTVRAALSADAANPAPVAGRLYHRSYGAGDTLERSYGPAFELAPGAERALEWRIADTAGAPIAEIGVELSAPDGVARADGSVYLDYLTWDGEPELTLTKPDHDGKLWRRAWVDAVDQFYAGWLAPLRIVQNAGTGLLIQGTREWRDYQARATVTPQLAAAAGIAARVQGLRRYYALLLRAGGKTQLVKVLDGETVLAEAALDWQLDQPYELRLQVRGTQIQGWVDGALLFDVRDEGLALDGGAVALICADGCVSADRIEVRPAA
jgi:ADP-ribosylglycohydrolase